MRRTRIGSTAMFGWFSRRKSLPPESPPEVPEEPPKREITAKINSLENVKYRSKKGSFKLPKEPLPYRLDVPSKVGSLTNLNHKPRASKVKIFSEKLDFRSNAHSKIAETLRSSQTSTPVSDKRGSIVEMLINSIKSSVGVQNPSERNVPGEAAQNELVKSSVDERNRTKGNDVIKTQGDDKEEPARNKSEETAVPAKSSPDVGAEKESPGLPTELDENEQTETSIESQRRADKNLNQSDPYESLDDTSEDELRETVDPPNQKLPKPKRKSTDRGPWRL